MVFTIPNVGTNKLLCGQRQHIRILIFSVWITSVSPYYGSFFFRPNAYRSKQRGKITVTRVLFFHLSFWLFAWPRHLAHDIDAARLNRRFENLLVKFSFINYFNNLITGCSSAMFPPLGWKAFLWRWAVFRHLYSWLVFPF